MCTSQDERKRAFSWEHADARAVLHRACQTSFAVAVGSVHKRWLDRVHRGSHVLVSERVFAFGSGYTNARRDTVVFPDIGNPYSGRKGPEISFGLFSIFRFFVTEFS